MSSDDNTNTKEDEDVFQENVFVFPEDGKKPVVDKYENQYNFMPGDKVYIRQPGGHAREGPHLIEKAESRRYTLCDLEGNTAKGGQKFEEKELEEYDPFE